MDSQSLKNILTILRQINSFDTGKSARQFLSKLAGEDLSDLATLKVAAYMIEQVDLARAVIRSSQLTDEAKAGVNATLDGIDKAFSLNGLQSALKNSLPQIASSISNFVILLSTAKISETEPIPPEAAELIKEINAVAAGLDGYDLDPVVREVAKKHIQLLSLMLSHIPIFGAEAALAAYFEMVVKLRRADVGSTQKSKEKTDGFWGAVSNWAGRLEAIDKIWNVGARLAIHADKAPQLLAYLPHI